jgi:hypothetical protein
VEYNRVEHDERTREAQHAESDRFFDGLEDKLDEVPDEIRAMDGFDIHEFLSDHRDQSGWDALMDLLKACARLSIAQGNAERDARAEINFRSSHLASLILALKEKDVRDDHE